MSFPIGQGPVDQVKPPEQSKPSQGGRPPIKPQPQVESRDFPSWTALLDFAMPKPGENKPIMAMVDNFRTPEVDIDGDGKVDLPHGVTSMIQSIRRFPDVRIRAFDQYESFETLEQRSKLPMRDQLEEGAAARREVLKALGDSIQAGERIDAVSSPSLTGIFKGNQRFDTTLEDVSKLIGQPVTYETLPENTSKIRNKLLELAKRIDEPSLSIEEFQFALIGKDIEAIEQNITNNPKQKTPFYLAAGNQLESINFLGFAEGAKLIGAKDAAGVIAPFSPLNPLVKQYARGVFNVVPVLEETKEGGEGQNFPVAGYNFTGTGQQMDIPSTSLSGQGQFVPEAIHKFAGRNVQDVLMKPEDFRKMDQVLQDAEKAGVSENRKDLPPGYSEKLISADMLKTAGLNDENIQAYRLHFGDYSTTNWSTWFRSDDKGKIYFSPDNSKKPGAIHVLKGTSGATPEAAAGDLMAKHQITQWIIQQWTRLTDSIHSLKTGTD